MEISIGFLSHTTSWIVKLQEILEIFCTYDVTGIDRHTWKKKIVLGIVTHGK